MLYISEKSENDGDIIVEFFKKVGIKARIIKEDLAVDKKFTGDDVVIFTSRDSLDSAMLTKDNCKESKVIFISSFIYGSSKNISSSVGVIFIKKDKKKEYLKKLLIFLEDKEKR